MKEIEKKYLANGERRHTIKMSGFEALVIYESLKKTNESIKDIKSNKFDEVMLFFEELVNDPVAIIPIVSVADIKEEKEDVGPEDN